MVVESGADKIMHLEKACTCDTYGCWDVRVGLLHANSHTHNSEISFQLSPAALQELCSRKMTGF